MTINTKHKFLPVLLGVEIPRADDVHIVRGDQRLRSASDDKGVETVALKPR